MTINNFVAICTIIPELCPMLGYPLYYSQNYASIMSATLAIGYSFIGMHAVITITIMFMWCAVTRGGWTHKILGVHVLPIAAIGADTRFTGSNGYTEL